MAASEQSRHDQRLRALRQLGEQRGLDAILLPGRGVITQYGYLQWAAGYCPIIRQGILLMRIDAGEPCLIVTSRSDIALARKTGAIADIEQLDNLSEALGAKLADTLADLPNPRIGVVGLDDIVSASMIDAWRGAVPAASFIDITQALLQLKAIKDEHEQQAMRETAAVADDALDAIVSHLRIPGVTLAAAAAEGDRVLRAGGAHETLIYVSKGPDFLHRATQETVDDGDLLTIYVELSNSAGYWVELARVAARGQLSAGRSKIVAATCAAMAAARDHLRSASVAGDVRDRIAAVIEQGGYTSGLWLGHGVGIDHDLPVIGRGVPTILQDGMTIALHPHLADAGDGASIGDTFIVTPGGGVAMSRWPVDLIAI